MAAHSNTVTQLIPIVFDFLFADDDALLTSGTDKVDIKQQGLCLSSMRRDRPRCIGYVEEVIPRYTLDDFRAIFRVGRGMFAELITLCGIQLSANHPTGGGRSPVSIEKTALVSLYYIGSQETMQKIAEKFELSEFSVISARVRFCQALLSKKEDLIKWPKVCTHTHTHTLSLCLSLSKISDITFYFKEKNY